MIAPNCFLSLLQSAGAGLFAGVPDSLLKDFCACLEQALPAQGHVITANEGNAIAIALGHHLATGSFAVVYMQNSGLGNAINPLASLASPEVYRVPMLLLIGWRGEPGVADEPQHVTQGRITQSQLDILDIPHWILDRNSDAERVVTEAIDKMLGAGSPVAILVREGTFSGHPATLRPARPFPLSREDALDCLLGMAGDALVISTTGKISREVYEIRLRRQQSQRDFLTVGGMGHASSIALGVALGKRNRRVVCLDGDGAAIMHLGAIPVIGSMAPGNLVHVLLNNAAHESVGGQPTVADRVDFGAIARSSGYRDFRRVSSRQELLDSADLLQSEEGPVLLQIDIAVGSRSDLGRPKASPEQCKLSFQDWAR